MISFLSLNLSFLSSNLLVIILVIGKSRIVQTENDHIARLAYHILTSSTVLAPHNSGSLGCEFELSHSIFVLVVFQIREGRNS